MHRLYSNKGVLRVGFETNFTQLKLKQTIKDSRRSLDL